MNRTMPAITVRTHVTIQPRSWSVGGGGPSRRRGGAGGCGRGAPGPSAGTSGTVSRSSTTPVRTPRSTGCTPTTVLSPTEAIVGSPTMDDAPDSDFRDRGVPRGLVLAATPLGDSRDASPRLREALATADVVAAEDTRRLRSLAAALGVTVHGRVVSHYDAVEAARLPRLLADVRAGRTVLVVTDAGMPAVSDPGYRLVAAAAAEGLPVSCLPGASGGPTALVSARGAPAGSALPGPSAVPPALVPSGLPVERFCFEGFAPRRDGQRRRWLATLLTEPRAVVFFESPHRLADTLAAAVDVLGPTRGAAVCRELTKKYEEVRRGTLAGLAAGAVD